jgi:hypothetical protein
VVQPAVPNWGKVALTAAAAAAMGLTAYSVYKGLKKKQKTPVRRPTARKKVYRGSAKKSTNLSNLAGTALSLVGQFLLPGVGGQVGSVLGKFLGGLF